MRAVRVGWVVLGCLIISAFTQFAFAHDGSWGDDATPLDIDWLGSGSELDLQHIDADPWKGWASLTVRNLCGDAWGDFHLRIKEVCSPWSRTDVIFDVTPAPELWIKDGLTWVQYTGLNWTLGPDGTTLDLFFYGNPIEHGDKALIKVYTDNTSRHGDWFTMSAYATPVPEPATIALLGIGAVALIRRTKR